MTTLNQIIDKREKLTRTGSPDYMTREDYLWCFKVWLQQQDGMNITSHIWLSKEKLLEDLEEGNKQMSCNKTENKQVRSRES